MTNPFGANWKTSVTMIGGTLMGALTFLSTVSYDQGAIAMVIPQAYKPWVAWIAGVSSLILFCYNGIKQKSKEVTGGSVQQTITGATASAGTQTLVDQTLVATKASNEPVTTEQQQVLNSLPSNITVTEGK